MAAPSATGTVMADPTTAVASAPVKFASTIRVFFLIVMLGTSGRDEQASGAGPSPRKEIVGWSVAPKAGAVGPAGPDSTRATANASSAIHSPARRRDAGAR